MPNFTFIGQHLGIFGPKTPKLGKFYNLLPYGTTFSLDSGEIYRVYAGCPVKVSKMLRVLDYN